MSPLPSVRPSVRQVRHPASGWGRGARVGLAVVSLTWVASVAAACGQDAAERAPDTDADSAVDTAGAVGDTAADTAADTVADTRDIMAETCHYDCFGGIVCVDGVVIIYHSTAVPCDRWTGECPSTTYTCAEGCAIRPVDVPPYASPEELCEESRTKQVGDPCVDEQGCEPQRATIDAAGDVHNVYLRCDTDLGECVDRGEPTVAGWLEQCGVVGPIIEEGYAYGYVRTDGCPEGVCLIADGPTCVSQGCTTPCEADSDCPMGAICTDQLLDWTGAGPYDIASVCKPGRPNLIGVGLSCPEADR